LTSSIARSSFSPTLRVDWQPSVGRLPRSAEHLARRAGQAEDDERDTEDDQDDVEDDHGATPVQP
jgi:hypothetical protein